MAIDALARLYRGLRQREIVRGDATGTRALEARLLDTLARVGEEMGPVMDGAPLADVPPRRIGVAMALALYSQSHVVRTFGGGGEPLVLDLDVMESALGISAWELEELQEEVDRRARAVLLRQAVVRWLAQHLSPERAFQQLFPGISAPGTASFDGNRVVGRADLGAVTASALHLPWLCTTGEGPLDGFRARSVDGHLKAALVRGLGVPAEAVDTVLEDLVVLLPEAGGEELLRADAWRGDGLATLTGIGASYTRHAWLIRPADGHTARWRDWLAPPGTAMPGPDRAFDSLFSGRLHAVLEALYADVLARRWHRPERTVELLDLIDLGPHLEAVQAPLLQWARARGSVLDVAQAGGIELKAAEQLLGEVATAWSERAAYWARPDAEQFVGSPQASWMRRVLRLEEALRGLSQRAPEQGVAHREVLFLFAGHFLAESPVDRRLLFSVEDGGNVGQAVARWFWPTWLRVLDHADAAVETTYPGFDGAERLF